MEWLFGSLFGVFVILWAVSLVVWIWALVDAIRVPDDSLYRSGDKLVWVLVIVLLQIVGAIIYLAVGRPRKEPAPPGLAGRDPTSMPPPPTPGT